MISEHLNGCANTYANCSNRVKTPSEHLERLNAPAHVARTRWQYTRTNSPAYATPFQVFVPFGWRPYAISGVRAGVRAAVQAFALFLKKKKEGKTWR